jgi:hypothetical protein
LIILIDPVEYRNDVAASSSSRTPWHLAAPPMLQV